MSIQFTFHAKGMDHPERPRRRAAFLLRVNFKLNKTNPPLRLRRDEQGLGPLRSISETKKIVRVWTKTAVAGARLDIFDTATSQDQTVYHLRAVEVAPPVPAPNTSPVIAKWYVRVFTKHGYVTNLGNWYCRFIAGTNEVSRHGYHAADNSWYGDAQDFGCPTAAQLDALANEIVRALEDPTDELYQSLSHVIVHDRIWEAGSWSHYDGIYHYHVHVDNNSGVPCSP